MPEPSLSQGPLTHTQKSKSFNCPECPEVFQTIELLVTHHKSTHDEHSHQKLLKYYIPALLCFRKTCVFCNIKFEEKQAINSHYRSCKWAKRTGFDGVGLEQLRGLLAWNVDIWLPKFYHDKVFWYVSRNDMFVNPHKYEEKENMMQEPKRRKTSV